VLADQLLRAVARLRRGQRVVGHQLRQGHAGVGPEHRDRTREHETRRGAAGRAQAQRVEQGARAVEVGAQAEFEIGLALARHRRGEVEHAVESLFAKLRALRQQRPGARLHARIGQQLGARGHLIGEHRLDLLVKDTVIVELKSVERFDPVFQAQVMSYLKLTGKPVGLIINFNTRLLKEGIHRYRM